MRLIADIEKDNAITTDNTMIGAEGMSISASADGSWIFHFVKTMTINMNHIDKNSLKHFFVCFLLSLVGAYGMCIAVGAALCKEWFDKKSYGHWCWWDILFDTLGCLLGYGTHCLIFK